MMVLLDAGMGRAVMTVEQMMKMAAWTFFHTGEAVQGCCWGRYWYEAR